MTELTPRDDTKKHVSEILKRVDQLIKKGDLQQALLEIERAKEIDPKNVYVHAYEERITMLVEEEKKKKASEETRRNQEEQAKKKLEEEWKKQEELRRRKEEEERRKADDGRQRKEEEQRQREAEKRKVEEETQNLEEERRQAEQAQGKKTEEVDEDRQHVYGLYKQALTQVWSDGAATSEEEKKLAGLRASLKITEDEHLSLETEVKRKCYSAAFRKAWSTRSITPEAASSLADLRRQFKISAEEHDRIEVELLWQFRKSQQRASIVVIDDDDKLLQMITSTLQDAGFDVKAYETSDEAYKLMKSYSPDIILSDINLETSTMGGFSFYEKIRELDHLQDVPFIFLSGMTDDILIRTGKELGVDDYLTKPFSDQTLLSTIRGKLKRYKQLKKARAKKD